MTNTKKPTLGAAFAIILCALTIAPVQSQAATAAEIDTAARKALKDLYAQNSGARALGKKAKGILVFPSITKGGFIVSGQHGQGALITPKGTAGYYSSVAASYGFQAGIQRFGYALFLMNDKAMSHLRKGGGWELGATPNLVIVDAGMAKSLSSTDLYKDIYAFFFNQKGLMGGIAIEGSKITKINPK